MNCQSLIFRCLIHSGGGGGYKTSNSKSQNLDSKISNMLRVGHTDSTSWHCNTSESCSGLVLETWGYTKKWLSHKAAGSNKVLDTTCYLLWSKQLTKFMHVHANRDGISVIFSPPVQVAKWALMHHFPSVCLFAKEMQIGQINVIAQDMLVKLLFLPIFDICIQPISNIWHFISLNPN